MHRVNVVVAVKDREVVWGRWQGTSNLQSEDGIGRNSSLFLGNYRACGPVGLINGAKVWLGLAFEFCEEALRERGSAREGAFDPTSDSVQWSFRLGQTGT